MLQAMSGILGSEAFKTSPSDFVTSTELKKIVVGFEAAYIKELFPDYNAKKTIRVSFCLGFKDAYFLSTVLTLWFCLCSLFLTR